MSSRSKVQILVVDDDPTVRKCLGILLMSAGYDVATADDRVSAVSHLSRAVPDLLVTDLNMPHIPGVELVSHVRSRHPSVSIIAMSGNYQGDTVVAGVIADRFYLKGQPSHSLLTTIASFDRDESGARTCPGKPRSPGTGLLEARRKICLEPS